MIHDSLTHSLQRKVMDPLTLSLQRKTEERLSLTLSLTHTHLGNRRRDDTSKTSSRTACCKHLLAPRSNQPPSTPALSLPRTYDSSPRERECV